MKVRWEYEEYTRRQWCSDEDCPAVLSVDPACVDPVRGQQYRWEVTLGSYAASGETFSVPLAQRHAERAAALFEELSKDGGA